MVGNKTVTCSSDGTWSKPLECKKVCTEPLPSLDSATFHINGRRLNDTVMYECDAGYESDEMPNGMLPC